MTAAEIPVPIPFLPVEIVVPERTGANLAVYLREHGYPLAETIADWRLLQEQAEAR